MKHYLLTSLLLLLVTASAAADGVFVRFRLTEPRKAEYYVRLAGYIHKSPWYLPRTVLPEGADREAEKRLPAGQFTDWFDLKKHAGDLLHRQMQRSGGVAEFPNVTADFVCDPDAQRRTVEIELATAPSTDKVVKRWRESMTGSLTSFLVSPDLTKDAGALETAAEMTERRLRWARQATGGQRHSPERLIVQTSFWGPQRPELNLKEAEVLRLLGFNVVGNQRPEVIEKGDFQKPGHTHGVKFGPASTREEIDLLMKTLAERAKSPPVAGVPFGFSDEIVSRPPIGENPQALAHFHAWLAQRKIPPAELGVGKLTDVVPIETPVVLREREKQNARAARRVFYYTSRFRQHAATERVRWHTEAFHKHFPRAAGSAPLTSTLVADHPYFSGSGLGMGMTPNPTWGNYPLACDWFDLGRRRAVDLIGVEDWMGLQYMYGPNTTWEGFQLMGFQAAIFRSASRGRLPIIAWITPSDETNLRLKSASALCQGAKHFFYWTYGPTATSTENYWSDLRGAYDGIAATTRHLAAAEHVLAPGLPRKTRVALLYSISSDLWQPLGYVHMLERRGTYLSLIHDQYLVDFLSEEDIDAGRLADYDVLYATDPCIKTSAAERIVAWVRGGGYLFGTTAVGSRDEFNEPAGVLASALGIEPDVTTSPQPGRYHIRGALNDMPYRDRIRIEQPDADRPAPLVDASGLDHLGVIGVKVSFVPTSARIVGTFQNGAPALVEHDFGRGKAVYVGACPAIAYIKEAHFVPSELKEVWPAPNRRLLNSVARARGVKRLAELSHAVVECGVYDAPNGTAVVLANFTYEPINALKIRLPLSRGVKTVRSVERGPLKFTLEKAAGHPGHPLTATFTLPLELTDVILLE